MLFCPLSLPITFRRQTIAALRFASKAHRFHSRSETCFAFDAENFKRAYNEATIETHRVHETLDNYREAINRTLKEARRAHRGRYDAGEPARFQTGSQQSAAKISQRWQTRRKWWSEAIA